jgi:hypothetical protein
MKLVPEHTLTITFELPEAFVANISTGNRKKRKVYVRVIWLHVTAHNFDRNGHPHLFGKVTVRGFFYKQDGELSLLQRQGDLRMVQLPLDIRSQVASFFWTLVPRGVLVNALGVPAVRPSQPPREPRSGTVGARTERPGTPLPPDPLAARSGQVVSPPSPGTRLDLNPPYWDR